MYKYLLYIFTINIKNLYKTYIKFTKFVKNKAFFSQRLHNTVVNE